MDLSSYLEPVIEDLEKSLGKPLPQGIYTGGAFSALLLGRIWGSRLEVQEPLEVCREVGDVIEDTSGMVTRFTGPLHMEDAAPDLSHNGFALVSAECAGKLIIRRVYRVEPVLTGPKDRVLYLLRGADINALQVGLYIDGCTRFLVATDAFWDFAASKQLRITCPVKGSAFVRLALYQAAFRAYVDWNEEALFMAGFRQLELPYENACDDMLSPEEYRFYEGHRGLIESFCSLKGHAEPVLPGLEEYFSKFCEICFHAAFVLDTVLTATKAVTRRQYFLTSYTYSVCFDVLVRKSTRKAIKKRFLRAMMVRSSSEHVLRHPRSLRTDFTTCHLLELQHFNSQHPAAMEIVVRLYQNFAQQLQAIRLLKKMSRKHGSADFMIGLVENAVSYGVKIAEISEETLTQLHEAYQLAEEPEIPPVDLQRFKYRDEVTELTSSQALYREGLRSSHCIGGYGGLLSEGNGKVRFFHISAEGKHSTAAVYYVDSEDVDREHYGPRNTNPPDRHKFILQELIGYLLKTVWKHADSNYQGLEMH